MTPGLNLLPVLLVGLAGSVHCVGMCGGVVSAFSAQPRTVIPVRVQTQMSARPARAGNVERVLAYNAGRMASYTLAGALAGSVGGGARLLAQVATAQMIMYWLANLMLVALGLYLMDAWRGVARIEQGGQFLWRRLQPLTVRLQPLDSPFKLLALGGVWGFLPCGMVYSVLATAMLSGSAARGAAVMLAFGLGTLPMLMVLGVAGARVRGALQQLAVRRVAGAVVLVFALLALARVLFMPSTPWFDALCMTGLS